jgi:myo-inositol-1(or 4)-monophosphatase
VSTQQIREGAPHRGRRRRRRPRSPALTPQTTTSTNGKYSRELAAAQEAALAAGRAIKGLYASTQLQVGQKSFDNPVTTADLKANQIIRERLASEFPEDGWLSEETEDDLERTSWNRVWVVDPLDGTKEFISQIGEFCVSIALVEEGRARLGVIYNPITAELFTAVVGEQPRLNGKPVSMSRQREVAPAMVLASRSENGRGEWDRFRGRFKVKATGSVAYKLALIAAGRGDATFSLTPKHEWDVCAGAALVEASGGKITDCDGEPLVFNRRIPPLLPGIVAANPELHHKLIAMVGTKGNR